MNATAHNCFLHPKATIVDAIYIGENPKGQVLCWLLQTRRPSKKRPYANYAMCIHGDTLGFTPQTSLEDARKQARDFVAKQGHRYLPLP